MTGSAPGTLDTEAVRRSWPEILDKVKEIRRVTWTLVSVNSTVLDYDGQRVLLGLSSEGLAATFNQGVHAEVVRQGLVDAIGLDARVEGTAAPGGAPPGASSHPQGPSSPGAAAPSAAEQLGVTGAARTGRQSPAPGGVPQAQEWAQVAREAPPAWATEEPATGPSAPASGQADPPPVQRHEAGSAAPRSAPPAGAPEPGRHSTAATSGAEPGHQQPGPQQAPGGTTQTGPAPAMEPPRAPGGDVPGDDDEDLESSGAVGLPVIESILGGTVIAVDDDPTH